MSAMRCPIIFIHGEEASGYGSNISLTFRHFGDGRDLFYVHVDTFYPHRSEGTGPMRSAPSFGRMFNTFDEAESFVRSCTSMYSILVAQVLRCDDEDVLRTIVEGTVDEILRVENLEISRERRLI